MTIDANTQINVTLNATQWNTVLIQLAEGPYRVVAPLLTAIQQQCMAQDQEQPELLKAPGNVISMPQAGE